MVRIGIDGRCLSGKLTGIGRYVFEIIKELDKLMPKAVFFVYSPKKLAVELPSERWTLRMGNSHNIIGNFLSGYGWLKFRCGQLAIKEDLDVFWANRTLLPNLPPKVRMVSTVHDFNHILQPQTMPAVNYMAHKLWFKRDVLRADKVLTNSYGTANKLIQYFKRKPDGVVQPSFGVEFSVPTKDAIKIVKKRYGVESDYLLAVATQEPRKNLSGLVRAYTSLRKKGVLDGYRLVLVGSEGWKNKEMEFLLSSLDDGSIITLGYVPNDDLPSLYGGAKLFVFPSFYEGFGMPVLEARACGTQVVTTDIPELREAGGENSIYVEPDPVSIGEGILKGLSCEHTSNACLPLKSSWKGAAEVVRDALSLE